MRIFTIIGVVLTVIGFGLLIYSFVTPSKGPFDFAGQAAGIASWTLIPLGIIFTLVGVYISRLLGNRGKLLREGIPGTATILGVSETGVYINQRPMAKLQLQITVPGRPPYTVEHNEVIPMLALGMITPGSTVPVAVDREDPDKLAIDWSGQTRFRTMGAPMGATPGGQSGSAGTPQPNTLSASGSATPNTLANDGGVGYAAIAPTTSASSTNLGTPMGMGMGFPVMTAAGGITVDLSSLMQRLSAMGINVDSHLATMTTMPTVTIDARNQALSALKQTGVSGRAVIREVEDMGVTIGTDKLMRYTLDVTPVGKPTYTVSSAGVVPANALSRAVAGATVPVHIDGTNPHNLMLDWDG